MLRKIKKKMSKWKLDAFTSLQMNPRASHVLLCHYGLLLLSSLCLCPTIFRILPAFFFQSTEAFCLFTTKCLEHFVRLPPNFCFEGYHLLKNIELIYNIRNYENLLSWT